MQARFWRYMNGAAVKIKINGGQVLHWNKSEPTDEGWRQIAEEYWHDGTHIYCRYQRDGRDCDGRHTTGGVCRVRIDEYCQGFAVCWREVNDSGPEITYPAWENFETDSVYDEFAQAAGY